MDTAENSTLGLVVDGGAYLMQMDPAGALSMGWAIDLDRVVAPTFLDLFGDGRDEFLFSRLGFLTVLTSDPAPNAESRPFGVRAMAVSATRVRVTWETRDPSTAIEVYRAVGRGDEPKRLQRAAGTTEFVDDSVRAGNTYRYELAQGDYRSEPATVFVGDQPKLDTAEALSDARIRVAFSMPMGAAAQAAHAYRLTPVSHGILAVTPASALRTGDPHTLILTMPEPMSSGDYMLNIPRPDMVADTKGMPLDPDHASAILRVAQPPGPPTGLARLRVYPNPVYPDRRHAARVTFANLPPGSVIAIYTPDGELVVDSVSANGTTRWEWDLLNEALRPVASGVYVYAVTWEALRRVGKIAILR